MLEKLIAYHCGPALAGIKPGNLVACYKDQIPDLKHKIQQLNAVLNKRDIFLEILCECGKRILLLVYRKKLLESYLGKSEIRALLSDYGYKDCSSLGEYILRLSQRLKQSDFPHEIGAFLGYPINDIYGFINHKDCGCLLVGEWRVYDDADTAKSLFHRYRCCRCAILRQIEHGKTLAQIFCAA